MHLRFLPALILLPSLVSCSFLAQPKYEGSGVSAHAARQSDSFDSVKLVGSIDVVIEVGEARSIVIDGDDNLIEHVITEVRGDQLEVRLENGSYTINTPLVVTVSMPELEAAELVGSGDLRISGLDAGALSLSVVGSGDVSATGKVDRLKAHVTGSGDMQLRELQATSVDAEVTGSGDLSLSVEENLKASVQGSGDIDYWGEPEALDLDTMGSGSITRH